MYVGISNKKKDGRESFLEITDSTYRPLKIFVPSEGHSLKVLMNLTSSLHLHMVKPRTSMSSKASYWKERVFLVWG